MPRIRYNDEPFACDGIDALWNRLVEDEGLAWGSSTASVVLAGRAEGRSIFCMEVVRHPADGWYIEFECGGPHLVFFQPDRNDASWSRQFVASDFLYDIDLDGIVWVKTSLDGEDARIRESCFIDDETARDALDKFLSDPDACADLPWTSIDEIRPYPRWAEYSWKNERNKGDEEDEADRLDDGEEEEIEEDEPPYGFFDEDDDFDDDDEEDEFEDGFGEEVDEYNNANYDDDFE